MLFAFSALAACGGGGSSDPAAAPPPPALVVSEFNMPDGTGNSTSAVYGGIAIVGYAEFNNTVASVAGSSGGIMNVSGTVPVGNSYAGLLALMYPPMSTFEPALNTGRIAPQNYSNQKELRIVAGSTSATRLQVQLVPQGGPFNGCVPTAELPVGSTPADITLKLNAADWAVPAHCTTAERALTLADTLRHLQTITVGITQDQVPALADGLQRSFSIGRIAFAGDNAAPIDRSEVVTVYNAPNGLGDSLSAQNGGFGFDLFSRNGNAIATVSAAQGLVRTSVTVPAGNDYGGLMLVAAGPGSTWFPSRADQTSGTGAIVDGHFGLESRLRIQVGSVSAGHVLVRLYPTQGPVSSCVPSFVLPVDGMAVSRDIALNDAGWFVPDYCSASERALTASAAAADLRSVAVGLTERSVNTIADGIARDFTLGEIAFVH
jgi:hypothetical protein